MAKSIREKKGNLWAWNLILGIGSLMVLGMAPRPPQLSMLVVPARYSVVQVGFDILAKRSAILVTYQGHVDARQPLLHAWNGKEWVYVSLADYQDASFLKTTPRQTILVGSETELPTILAESSLWCPKVWRVSSTTPSSLINNLDKIFAFQKSEWQWFASRYNLDLIDTNAGRRQDSWYNHPFVEPRKFSDTAETPEYPDPELSPDTDPEFPQLDQNEIIEEDGVYPPPAFPKPRLSIPSPFEEPATKSNGE